MIKSFRKVFLLSISILYFNNAWAQSFEIPLFDYPTSETPQSATLMPQSAAQLNMPAPSPVQNTNTSITPTASAPKKIDLAPSRTEPVNYNLPNLGRNEEPLKDLTVSFDPLPTKTIDLPIKKPTPLPEEKPLPTNTRQEKINLPHLTTPIPITATETEKATLAVHDVTLFDINGLYLGVTPEFVAKMAQEKGYRVAKVKKALAIFQTSYYDTLCRNAGFYLPEEIRACIRQAGKKEKNTYISEVVLEKKSSRESFQIFFTSPATGNEAYQIIYQNKGDNSLNFTTKNKAKKLNRQRAFVEALIDTYGNPDDEKNWIWGDLNKNFMHVAMTGSAYDITMTFFDRTLYSEDFMAAEDWKEDHEIQHQFGFAE